MTIEVGELRALPVGRGQIGRVKYLALGRGKPGQGHGAGGGGAKAHIPQSVIKTGVKLPQIQMGGVRSQLQVDKPFYEQMRQELDQIAPTISDNPFMKNDKRKNVPYQRENVNEATEINNNDNQDLSMVDELQAIQKDDLKRELCSVLKEMRKEEDDLFEKLDDGSENEEMSDVDGDEASTNSQRSSSSNSDITIECDEILDPHDDKNNMDVTKISENDEEEISAL